MHAAKLSLVNYRNFSNVKLFFHPGVNTVIGENGSGKTNLFRAMRLLLDDRMVRSAYRLEEQDFCRYLSDWKGHWIIISLEFEDLSQDESVQALFCHTTGVIGDDQVVKKATYNLIFRPKWQIRKELSEVDDGDHDSLNELLSHITIDDYETIFTGKSSADFNDEDIYKRIVGDFENAVFSDELEYPEIGTKIPKMLSLSREISFTFIQALRDVVSQFRDNRTNPLLALLKSKSGEIKEEDFEPILNQVTQLNSSIQELDGVQEVRTDIGSTIKDAVGETYSPKSLSIQSALSDEADKLFQSLKLFIGESSEEYEETIHELSLGGANLIYLTLKLLEFKYQDANETLANFLLVEEPEAHIHTHIQKSLFDKLEFPATQIIYSTHSNHISEVSNIQSINILGRNGVRCEAYQPCTGLEESQSVHIQRYLDAVRNNLLFAKSVILVEGDAEEILIPVLVKKVLGISLDELGISLINIRSTGFENIALLFHDDRIRKKCSILTDLDVSIINTNACDDDSEAMKKKKKKYCKSEKAGKERKERLEQAFGDNTWVNIFYAHHTFEVDFISEGNSAEVISTLPGIYSTNTKITQATTELNSDSVSDYGTRVLTMTENVGKGWFAILLSNSITPRTLIPDYILNAIFCASPRLSRNTWIDILKYRIDSMKSCRDCDKDSIDALNQSLNEFSQKKITSEVLHSTFLEMLPNDPIVKLIAHMQTCL